MSETKNDNNDSDSSELFNEEEKVKKSKEATIKK